MIQYFFIRFYFLFKKIEISVRIYNVLVTGTGKRYLGMMTAMTQVPMTEWCP